MPRLTPMRTQMTEVMYSEAPTEVKSVVQSTVMLSGGLGFGLGSSMTGVMKKWVTENIDDGALHFVFIVVMGVMLINVIAFFFLGRCARKISPDGDAEDLTRPCNRHSLALTRHP